MLSLVPARRRAPTPRRSPLLKKKKKKKSFQIKKKKKKKKIKSPKVKMLIASGVGRPFVVKTQCFEEILGEISDRVGVPSNLLRLSQSGRPFRSITDNPFLQVKVII
jgi:hypothetical protein